jgi:lipoyl(octanoyl) transferase
MAIFKELQLWIDPVKRSGPAAMAVDEWLLDTATKPVLRVYRWAGEWASIGYFGKIVEARGFFGDLELVRRWTGGGMVDHRADWTYTVVAPRGEPLAGWRGAESYRQIHAALAKILIEEGTMARVSRGDGETGATLCFENPVTHDLLGVDGRKLAGAGQRRSRSGLLHQGSVSQVAVDEDRSQQRAESFAGQISAKWDVFHRAPSASEIMRRAEARYVCDEWMNRR